MSTIEQIVHAAKKLSPAQLETLRKKLDALEERDWQAERRRVARQLKAREVTDAEIDRAIARRRRHVSSTPSIQGVVGRE